MQQVKRFPPHLRVVAGRPLTVDQQRHQVRSAFSLDREEIDDPQHDVLVAIGRVTVFLVIALMALAVALWIAFGAPVTL